jgi:hypothetical protein
MARGKKGSLPREIVPLPIHCSGSGCGEETALLLPGKLPYHQGIWMEDGWQLFNHLENRSVLFVCPKCRERGERSGQLTHKETPVTVRA